MPDNRLNILFLMDDQHRWDALGCRQADAGTWLASGPPIRTPHLDELARTGTVFTNAVCTVPVCVPSRYSLLTGLRGYQLGVLDNGHYMPEAMPVPTLGQALAGAGYRTASFGKMHWKPAAAPAAAVPDSRGFAIRATNDGEQTDGPSELRFEDVLTEPELELRRSWPRRFGRGGENRAGYVGEVAELTADRFPEQWLADRAIDFLREHAARPDDTPFGLMLSLDRPHPESVVPADYADWYRPDEMLLPPPAPPGFREDDWYLGTLRRDLDWQGMPDAEVRTAIARYLTNVSYVDACFGRVLRALDELGLADTTLVVFTADHGELLGERDLHFSKYSLYEAALRVPLIVRWPGLGVGRQIDAPVELVDLMPTWLTAAGLALPDYLAGHALRPLLTGPPPPDWRRVTLTEHYTPVADIDAPRTQWAVRDDRYKLIERLSGASALYDLSVDPDEFDNRIDDPALAAVRADLRDAALREVMRCAQRYPARNPAAVARAF